MLNARAPRKNKRVFSGTSGPFAVTPCGCWWVGGASGFHLLAGKPWEAPAELAVTGIGLLYFFENGDTLLFFSKNMYILVIKTQMTKN